MGVYAGVGVKDGVAETTAVAVSGMDVSTSAFSTQAANMKETKIKEMTLRRNLPFSIFNLEPDFQAHFDPAG